VHLAGAAPLCDGGDITKNLGKEFPFSSPSMSFLDEACMRWKGVVYKT